MSVARVSEITSFSDQSFEHAIDSALARANETIEHIEGAWIKDMKVTVRDGKINQYQVNLKLTFVLH